MGHSAVTIKEVVGGFMVRRHYPENKEGCAPDLKQALEMARNFLNTNAIDVEKRKAKDGVPRAN